MLSYVKNNEQEFIAVAEKYGNSEAERAAANEGKELIESQNRLSELDVIFRKLYEDSALGRISDKQFAVMTAGYDEERESLTQKIKNLENSINEKKERKNDIGRFVKLVRQYTEITELTYENVHEFIDRILIHELDKETNTRKIEIFYNFVGKIDSNEKPCENVSYFRQIGADITSIAV